MSAPEPSSPPPGCIAAILPAAGSGERFGSDQNKLFAPLLGKPLWFHAAARLRDHSLVGPLVMTISARDHAAFTSEFASLVEQLKITLVIGGAERTDSVEAGLQAISADPAVQLVAIHDAARPLIRQTDLSNVFSTAWQTGAAILGTPIAGTVKRDLGQSNRSQTVDRRELWLALTPQVFRVGLLNEAYQKHNGRPATDDAQLVERCGHDVALVRGSADNLKITHPEDLHVAAAILARMTQDS